MTTLYIQWQFFLGGGADPPEVDCLAFCHIMGIFYELEYEYSATLLYKSGQIYHQCPRCAKMPHSFMFSIHWTQNCV